MLYLVTSFRLDRHPQRIFGYEVDGLDLVIRDGLPQVTGTDGASEHIAVLAVGLASNIEDDFGVDGEFAYIGTSGGAWKAQALYGSSDPEDIARASRGNGVMVYWPKGSGEVFCAATCEWVMGLTRQDGQVEQVTRNVLTRFLCRPES